MKHLIVLLLTLSNLNCTNDNSTTKALDRSQVVNAHFNYEQLKIKYLSTEHSIEEKGFHLGDPTLTDVYHLKGTITNNSGINLYDVGFFLTLYIKDKEVPHYDLGYILIEGEFPDDKEYIINEEFRFTYSRTYYLGIPANRFGLKYDHLLHSR